MLAPTELSYPRDGAANIVKDGTPHEALSSACRSRRSPDTRGGLSPACFPSAPCRSLCDRRGLPTRDCSPRLAPWAGVPFLTFLGTDLHRPSKPGGPQECQGWQPRGARRGVTAPSTGGAARPPHTEQPRRGLLALTRTSHQSPAAAADAPHPAMFSPLGVLDVPSRTPPRPTGRKPHWARYHGTHPTNTGEKCGLVATSPCGEMRRI